MKSLKLLNYFLAEKYHKKSGLGKKKNRQIYRNNSFKAQAIHFLMASSTNLFGFEQIEADSGVNPTLIFEEINKDLKSTCWRKVSTPIQQMVFLTSWKL